MHLPTVNAILNVSAATLLLIGYVLIRRGRRAAHRACMVGAFGASLLFLTVYLYYHAQVGSIRFRGEGTIRAVYLTILATHSMLAAAVPFLASITIWRAWRGRLDAHRRLARWTLPIWLYVSVTGVVIYLMLYHL